MLSSPTITWRTTRRTTFWRCSIDTFECLGDLEGALGVVQFGVERGELRLHGRFALAECGHPDAEFLECEQLFR